MLRAFILAAAIAAAPALAADPAADAAHAYAIDTAGTVRSLKVGETGKLVLVVRADEPRWHVHPQAPLKLRVEAPAGLRVAKAELGRKDLVDPKAAAPRFEVPVVGAAPGRHEVKATLDFFVCSDTACVKQARTVSLPVDVN